jgi:hypothetical protein
MSAFKRIEVNFSVIAFRVGNDFFIVVMSTGQFSLIKVLLVADSIKMLQFLWFIALCIWSIYDCVLMSDIALSRFARMLLNLQQMIVSQGLPSTVILLSVRYRMISLPVTYRLCTVQCCEDNKTTRVITSQFSYIFRFLNSAFV